MDNQQQTNFQQQMQLQKIAAEKKQLAASIIEKRMAEELMPTVGISIRWKRAVKKAIMNSSPLSYQAKLTDFADAVRIVAVIDLDIWDGKLSLSQFQTIANSLDAASPASLDASPDDYYGIVQESIALVSVWSEKISLINQEGMVEAETQYNMKHAAKNGLKPVTGQA
jgi:hypothetical protein